MTRFYPVRVQDGPGLQGQRRLTSLSLLSSLTRLAPTARYWPVIVIMTGLLLRLVPWLSSYPLHPDEALYGYWARLIVSGSDPFLLGPWVDKPPLVPYLLAGSLRVFGVSDTTLRLPGLVASTALLAALYGFARAAFGPSLARLATLLLAASPFAILFAPTAFTDPWLALWLVAAAWAALSGRAFWSGLLLGLAVASKQQGVFGAPLIVAFLALSMPGRHESLFPAGRLAAFAVRRFLPALGGFLLILVPVTWWDSLRWLDRPSFWDRSLTAYGGLGLAPLATWPKRAAEWAGQLSYLSGSPLWSGTVLLLAALAGGRAVLHLLAERKCRARRAGLWASSEPCSSFHTGRVATTDLRPVWHTGPEAASGSALRSTWIDAILALYTCGYLTTHFLITFQPWDRYLLPIVPLVVLLAARGLALIGSHRLWKTRPDARAAAGATLVLVLSYAAWQGVTGRLPVGSDHGAYAGLDHVVAFVRTQETNGVIYDHSLGWFYDFYMFGATLDRRWWDTGSRLAANAERTAREQPLRPQWLILSSWENLAADDAQQALSRRGMRLAEHERIYRRDGSVSFIVYEILGPGGEHGS